MARPRDVSGLRRPIRWQIGMDPATDEDLRRIAEGWGVPPATAAYWLLRGIVSDLRGESVRMAGDPLSERAAWWMRHRLESEPGPPDPLDLVEVRTDPAPSPE